MPEEQLKAFLEAVKSDAGLQEQLKAAGDADSVVAIAKAAGFVISAEDLKQAERGEKRRAGGGEELTDVELESVAGGWNRNLEREAEADERWWYWDE